MNIRDSAVLGLVGVAGLDRWIENYRSAFDYRSIATLVLVTMLGTRSRPGQFPNPRRLK